MVGNYDRAGLVDLKLVEKDDGKYYLDATYEYENKYGIYKLNIPKIILPVYTQGLPDYVHTIHAGYYPEDLKVNLGFGELQVERDLKTDMTYRITEIQKKPRKMTLSEVEAALGYSVELVSEAKGD